ncbi:MAG: outer membrane lipoprotein carrier protein LolA [Ferrovibrio sp.]|uniref:LolA family protein n=1 Tax=Ferrovibrio sp. TaxID=1917215 RepID=UPI002614E57A|nr:outer membrane lipoprotein carrier protein LolA [Ferrovibrio sp.]MCW0236208.1 outer membrane lipoprotein carrier protein LolA [Ferrovibrio sp.]
MTDRRRFLLAMAVAATAAKLPLAAAYAAAPAGSARLTETDRADLKRIADYFNTVRSMQGRFLQVAPDGSAAEGKIYMTRPGRFRFEFDPPVPMLIVSDGAYIIMEDRELKSVERIPLGATPLDLLLREKVVFDDSVGIARVERGAAILRVTLFAPERPKEGALTVVFGDRPLEFAGWTVTDAQGKDTAITLSQVDVNPQINPRLYTYGDRPAVERALQQRR